MWLVAYLLAPGIFGLVLLLAALGICLASFANGNWQAGFVFFAVFVILLLASISNARKLRNKNAATAAQEN